MSWVLGRDMSADVRQRLADFLMIDLIFFAGVLPFRLMTAVGLTQAGWDQYRPLVDDWRYRPLVDDWRFGPLIAVCELAVAIACFRVAHSALRTQLITPAQGWAAIIATGIALAVRCLAHPAIDRIEGPWGDWGVVLVPFRAVWLFAYSVVIVRQIALWHEAAEARS